MASRAVKTRMSTKGQVILPKETRDRLRLKPGAEFVVEETSAGILLKPQPLFPAKSVDEVAGMLKGYWTGPPPSEKDIENAIAEDIRQQHARGRY